jgi:hypothetical protein
MYTYLIPLPTHPRSLSKSCHQHILSHYKHIQTGDGTLNECPVSTRAPVLVST